MTVHTLNEDELPPVNVMITELSYSLLPRDDINHGVFEVKVAWRGGDRYAVMHGGWCLGRDGEWDYEMRPSSREDDWLVEHRYSYEEAQHLAVTVAPTVVCNGHTALEVATKGWGR